MQIEDESVYCGKQVTLIIHVCRIEKTLEFQYQSMVNERVTTISTQPCISTNKSCAIVALHFICAPVEEAQAEEI